MAIQMILAQKGPLPINATFQAVTNGPTYLEVNGSVWTQTANNMIGISIEIDGQAVGTAQIFSNANATHRAVVPAYIPLSLAQGSHTIALKTMPNSTTVS